MKHFVLLLLALILVGCVSTPKNEKPVLITTTALNGTIEKFEKHKNYLALDLPYAPMKRVLEQVETRLGRKLANRGESHVTVLTPPEFDAIKTRVSIDEINSIAEKKRLQRASLKAVCIGRGEAVLEAQTEQTYFVVIEAPDLVVVRREIQALVEKRGGVQLFSAELFRPHITLGFTKADLHENQGVIKDQKTCLFDVEVLAE